MPNNQQLQSSIDSLTKTVSEGFDFLKTATADTKNELLITKDEVLNKIDTINNRLADIEKDLNDKTDKILAVELKTENNTAAINLLTSRLVTLENSSKMYHNLPTDMKNLEEKLEERTNRQLRETLVFQNIPETPQKYLQISPKYP